MTLTYSIARFRSVRWFCVLILLVVAIEHVVTTLPVFTQRPELPLAVTFDLLVGIPLLFYFMVARRYRLPITSVVGAFAACLALGYWLIPAGQQQYLRMAGHALALLEVLTAGWAFVNLRRIVRAYRAARSLHSDFVANLGTAFQAVLGRSLAPLVFEVSIFRYALLGWWATPEVRPADAAFTSHRESGFPALVVVGGFALLVETTAVHLLALHWSHMLANCLLVVDVYTVLMLVAHGQAVRLRPTLLTPDALILRVGFAWRLTVPRTALVAAEPLTTDTNALNLSKLLFAAPNLLLTFAEPVVVTGPYGIRRTVNRVAVYLDQPQQFITAAGFSSSSFTR